MIDTKQYLQLIEYYKQHPTDFVKEVNNFELTDQQKQVFEILPKALKEGKSICVKSGHGTGKTFTEANLLAFLLCCYPKIKIVCLANTFRQLMDVMRTEVTKVLDKCKFKEMFDTTQTTVKHIEFSDEWFATFRTANKPESIQGFHSDNGLVFLIDEASGIETNILEAIEGALTQKNNIIMMFGNPTRLANPFHSAFNEKKQFYYTFTFNSEESPLVKPEFCKMLESKYGRDSDVYRVRVLGQFPKINPDSIISITLCEEAVVREPVEQTITVLELGVDVARFGGDKTQMFERKGTVFKHYLELSKKDTMTTVGEIVKYVHDNENNVDRIYVTIDDTGVGGGVTDRLKELLRQDKIGVNCEVIISPVNNGSRAKDSKQFQNKVIEMYWFLKEYLKLSTIPNDVDLIGELTSRKYNINSNAQLCIEKKDVFKKRIGHSPDKADSFVLSCHSLIYQNEIISNANNREEEVDIETVVEEVKKFNSGSLKDRISFFKKLKK